MTANVKTIDDLAVASIRTLAIDAIEKAKSGHPGMPMGAAPMAYELWARFMKHSPANPEWINRDRFVLSAGHGSMLLYSLLHLFGYEDCSMEEIQNFRQWGSKTPGHPEYGHTRGVDATTGPLGQGLAMAVGMAMAEAHLANVYNRDSFNVIDHYTYAICGDGCLMEGISSEAASLAGHYKLGKLIVLYDSNDISLDGELSLSMSENVHTRFAGYGWQTLRVEDGNDLEAIRKAIAEAKADTERPTLIEVKTIIGYGSPNKQGKGGSAGPHGSPLGPEEALLTKEFYGWPHPEFYVPEEVRAHFAALREEGVKAEQAWQAMFAEYRKAYPDLAQQLEDAIAGKLPEGWDADLPWYSPEDKGLATRASSGAALNAIAKRVPNLIGGSADLESSTQTHMKGIGVYSANDYAGRNVYFGVREFGMAAAANGMALHGGLKPYVGTFFVFSDYLRPAVRLSALMKVPVIYVFTHDSIAVGEDGPTHEPIEQLPALRVIPGVTVIRPADGNETSAAWKYAVENTEGPVALVLTRQALPNLPGTKEQAVEGVRRGAYVVSEAKNGNPQGILIATGSEVALAVKAQEKLAAEGVHVRVVSMPSWELFEKQSAEYKESVLPKAVTKRLAVEMAYPLGWEKYVGSEGAVLGISTFGASAPGDRVIREYGFTVENVTAKFKALL
jgi:transketolase